MVHICFGQHENTDENQFYNSFCSGIADYFDKFQMLQLKSCKKLNHI